MQIMSDEVPLANEQSRARQVVHRKDLHWRNRILHFEARKQAGHTVLSRGIAEVKD